MKLRFTVILFFSIGRRNSSLFKRILNNRYFIDSIAQRVDHVCVCVFVSMCESSTAHRTFTSERFTLYFWDSRSFLNKINDGFTNTMIFHFTLERLKCDRFSFFAHRITLFQNKLILIHYLAVFLYVYVSFHFILSSIKQITDKEVYFKRCASL